MKINRKLIEWNIFNYWSIRLLRFLFCRQLSQQSLLQILIILLIKIISVYYVYHCDNIYVCRKISGSTYYQRIYIQIRQFMHVIFARGSHSTRILPKSFVLTYWKFMQRSFRHQMMQITTSSEFFPPIPTPTLLHPTNQKRMSEILLDYITNYY